MKQSSKLVFLALGVAVAVAACSGGNNASSSATAGSSPAAGASPAATANQSTTGSHMKQLNPMHVAHNAMSAHRIDINMGAMNGSKQDGSASIVDQGNHAVVVTVKTFNEPKGASEPSHIHQGTCKNLNPAPWKPLHNVVNGVSVTTISGLSVGDIKKGKYAINVHKSATDIKTYVSCGDLSV